MKAFAIFKMVVFLMILFFCKFNDASVLYPFGTIEGDFKLKVNEQKLEFLTLNHPIPPFSSNEGHFMISEHGIVGNSQKTEYYVNGLTGDSSVIAAYNAPFNLGYGGDIFYRIATDDFILNKTVNDIKRINKTDTFKPTQAVVVSYINVSKDCDWPGCTTYALHTFQVVVVSDDTTIYAILNYGLLGSIAAVTGYSDQDCNIEFFRGMTNSTSLAKTSNIGIPGRHVFKLTKECVTISKLYPYGPENGDMQTRRGDNVVAKFNLTQPMLISKYEKLQTLYIYTDGIISSVHNAPRNIWPIPTTLNGIQRHTNIAVYPMDLDTTITGKIFYREVTDASVLNQISADITSFTGEQFTANHSVIVTYDKVPYITNLTEKHTFQATIATDGTRSYLLLTYIMLHASQYLPGFKSYCNWDWLIDNSIGTDNLRNLTNTGVSGRFIFDLTPRNCLSDLFYLSNSILSNQDSSQFTFHSYGSNYHILYSLEKRFKVFSSSFYSFYLSSSGAISFNQPFVFSEPLQHRNLTIIYPFSTYLQHPNFTGLFHSGIHLEITSYPETLLRIAKDIGSGFQPQLAIIVSYLQLPHGRYQAMIRNTFQVILATDNNKTYAIFNYHSLDSMDAVAGFSEALCDEVKIADTSDNRDLSRLSNVGVPGRFVFELTAASCAPELFPYGPGVGDKEVTAGDNNIGELKLSEEIPLSKETIKDLFINTNGYITINEKINVSYICIASYYGVIAPYSTDFDTTKHGNIYFRETKDSETMQLIEKSIRKVRADFNSTSAVVLSYIKVPSKYYPTRLNTFQVVITTGNNETYLIFSYKDLDSLYDSTDGFSEKSCNWRLFETNYLLMTKSNIGVTGRHVYRLNSMECGNPQLYPYGYGYGNYWTFPKKKSRVEFQFSRRILIFSELVSSLVVYVDSYITFGTTYFVDRERFPLNQVISLYQSGYRYWDWETFYGYIYYGETWNKVILNTINKEIYQKEQFNFKATRAVIVTFYRIQNYVRPETEKIMQITLATNENVTYAVMKYLLLGWETGTVGLSDPTCKVNTLKEMDEEKIARDSARHGLPRTLIYKVGDKQCIGIGNHAATTTTTSPKSATTAKTSTSTATELSTSAIAKPTTAKPNGDDGVDVEKDLMLKNTALIIGGVGGAIVVAALIAGYIIKYRKGWHTN